MLRFIGLALAGCALLSAQNAEESRVLRLDAGLTLQQFLEQATVIRSIAEIRDLTTVNDQHAITMRAAPPQIELAGWIARELELPPHPGKDFRIGDDDLVRVFYVRHAANVQQFQEIATLVRSIFEIRRVFTYNAPGAIVIRGTPEQIAGSEWLLGELDKTLVSAPDNSKPEYRLAGTNDGPVVRVLRFQNPATVLELQEAATMMRSITEIRRLFTCNGPRVVVLRGSAPQLAAADWLMAQADRAVQRPSALTSERLNYPASEDQDTVIGVFRMVHADSPQRVNEIATSVRTTEQIRRAFILTSRGMLALRGTAAQVDGAQRLIAKLDQ